MGKSCGGSGRAWKRRENGSEGDIEDRTYATKLGRSDGRGMAHGPSLEQRRNWDRVPACCHAMETVRLATCRV